MIRIGDAWVRPGDIAAVQHHHGDYVALFLGSGRKVFVRGVTVGEVIQAMDAFLEEMAPVIIPMPPVRSR